MADPADRRAAERYPVNSNATCPFLSPVVEDFGPVKIRDVSMQGVGLLVNRRVEPGAVLAVVLENTGADSARRSLSVWLMSLLWAAASWWAAPSSIP